MINHFLEGFCDELTKEAATAPLMATVRKGATMLGKVVKTTGGKMVKKMKGLKKKADDMFGTDAGSSDGGDDDDGGGESDADKAAAFLRQLLEQAQDSGEGGDQQTGADAPLYGGGAGLSAQRPTTVRTPTRQPAAPKKQMPPANIKPTAPTPGMPGRKPPMPSGGMAPPSRQTPDPRPKPPTKKPLPNQGSLPTDLD
jgi:hypothetical protein